MLHELSVEASLETTRMELQTLIPAMLAASGEARSRLCDSHARAMRALASYVSGSTFVDRVPEKLLELDAVFDLLEESGYIKERVTALETRRSELAEAEGVLVKS